MARFFEEDAVVKKQDSEAGIRHLCYKWAELRGVRIPSIEQPSFADFLSWVRQNYGWYLKFRTTGSVEDQVEKWFDEVFGQTWRK